MSEGKRLNKYISDSGFCSRREADRLISQGKVTINGSVAVIGSQVYEGDTVAVDGKKIRDNRKKVYLAFNKPPGITCTTDRKDPTNIIDYIGYSERIFPIGRLDKDSEGLILLTNDGDVVNRILRAGNNHEKEYLVTVDKTVTDNFITKMSSGVRIHKTTTKPCKVRQTGAKSFSITLVEGLNRQIRLMCEAFGYEVVGLKRVRVMNVTLNGIGRGNYRMIKGKELDAIMEATKDSSNLESASTGGGGKKRQNKSNPSVRYAAKQKKSNLSSKKKQTNGRDSNEKAGTPSGKFGKAKRSPIRNKMKRKK